MKNPNKHNACNVSKGIRLPQLLENRLKIISKLTEYDEALTIRCVLEIGVLHIIDALRLDKGIESLATGTDREKRIIKSFIIREFDRCSTALERSYYSPSEPEYYSRLADEARQVTP